MDGVLLSDKPAGSDLARRGRARCAARSAAEDEGRPRRHARPVRHRACCSCSWAGPRARSASSWRCRRPTGRGAARLDLDDRRPRRRARRDRPRCPSALELPTGEHAPAPAGLLGGEGRRASAPTSWRARGEDARAAPSATVDRPPRSSCLARGRPRRVRDRVLVRHLRALAHRRPRRRLLRRARAHARSARSGWRTPTRSGSSPLGEALAFLPRDALAGDGRAAAHGVPVPANGRRVPAHEGLTRTTVRLTHDGDVPAPSASRARAAELQPVVVFAPA